MNMNENPQVVQPGIPVTLPCKEIRRIAREKLKGNWMKLMSAFIVFEILTTLVATILNSEFNYSVTTDNVGAFFGLTSAQLTAAGITKSSVLVPFGGFFYNLIIAPSFVVGLCGLLIAFFRGKEIKSEKMFFETVKAAFAMRRKTLANNLISSFSLDREAAESIISICGLSLTVRGEALSSTQIALVSDELYKYFNGGNQ